MQRKCRGCCGRWLQTYLKGFPRELRDGVKLRFDVVSVYLQGAAVERFEVSPRGCSDGSDLYAGDGCYDAGAPVRFQMRGEGVWRLRWDISGWERFREAQAEGVRA